MFSHEWIAPRPAITCPSGHHAHRPQPVFACGRIYPRTTLPYHSCVAPMDRPVCVNVLVVVAEGREDEFLEVMRLDAIGSRSEPGCICFHVSAAPDPRTYMFYEVYANGDAVTFHKNTDHYARWDAFRNGGGIERQHNTVCEGVFVTEGDLSDPSGDTQSQHGGSQSGSQTGHLKAHGGASYDYSAESDIPRRAQRTQAPPDFGHPRGLIEDPIRPGTWSNFGRKGVRHIKKASPHTYSPSSESCISNQYGGLTQDAEGLILPPGSARKTSPVGEKMRQRHEAHFSGFAPGSDDGSENNLRQKGGAIATSHHLDKNFSGMALTHDPTASQPKKVAGQQFEWSKQVSSSDRFTSGGGLKPRSGATPDKDEVKDFQSRKVDVNLPWTRQLASDNFNGMGLTQSPDPKSPPRQASSPFDCEAEKNADPFHNITTKRRTQQPLPPDAAGGSRGASTVRLTGSHRKIVSEMTYGDEVRRRSIGKGDLPAAGLAGRHLKSTVGDVLG